MLVWGLRHGECLVLCLHVRIVDLLIWIGDCFGFGVAFKGLPVGEYFRPEFG